jgi:hypothetical protein
MTNHSAPYEFAGPGLTRQTYLDILAAGQDTGWWDEHGVPAPWPEDFNDPHSGWQLTTGGDTTTNPNQPY